MMSAEANKYVPATCKEVNSPATRPRQEIPLILKRFSAHVVAKLSFVFQAVLNEPLTLDEEDTLAAVLTQWSSLRLIDFAGLAEKINDIDPSDSSWMATAMSLVETLLLEDAGANPLTYWASGLQVRARYVKGVMSAAATRKILDRKSLTQAQIDSRQSKLRTLKEEESHLSAALRDLKSRIDEVKSLEAKTQKSIEEISVPAFS